MITRQEYFDLIGDFPENMYGSDWENRLAALELDDFSCPGNNCGNPKEPSQGTCGDH